MIRTSRWPCPNTAIDRSESLFNPAAGGQSWDHGKLAGGERARVVRESGLHAYLLRAVRLAATHAGVVPLDSIDYAVVSYSCMARPQPKHPGPARRTTTPFPSSQPKHPGPAHNSRNTPAQRTTAPSPHSDQPSHM